MIDYKIEITAYTTKIISVRATSLTAACIKAQEEIENIIDSSQTLWNFKIFSLEDDDHNDIYDNKFFRDEETDMYRSYDDIIGDEHDFQ